MDKKIIAMLCRATGMVYDESEGFLYDAYSLDTMPEWVPGWANCTHPSEVLCWISKEAKTNPKVNQEMSNVGLDKVRVVELEPGVWLAPWPGNPGVTVSKLNARFYATEWGARVALGKARKYGLYEDASITPV